jgi:1,4-dihydroxy-2-naphthoyl-CoA hydrolase
MRPEGNVRPVSSPQVPWEETLDGVLGFEVLAMERESAAARFDVADKHRQPFGVVHGGVYATLAEGLCSAATWQAHGGEKLVMGSGNHTSFLRPVFEGTVTAEARAMHSGRTTAVWEVEFRNAEERICALARVTLAIRDSG